MTIEQLKELGRHLARRTRETVMQRMLPVHAQLAEHARRLDALEGKKVPAKPRVKFHGEWDPKRRYGAGDSVLAGGQMWIATGEHLCCRPGEHPVWRLAIKTDVIEDWR